MQTRAEIAATKKVYYLENSEELIIKQKKYYLENKEEIAVKTKAYRRTKIGLITRIYAQQRRHSKARGYTLPTYTKKELQYWLFSQTLFHELFDSWKTSGFDKNLIPSVDRKNDYKSYTLGNIQIMTWKQNFIKSHKDRKEGRNNKMSKAVNKYDLQGNFIKRYYSAAQAYRKTKSDSGSISRCCNGKQKTAGGYKWEHDNSQSKTRFLLFIF